MKILALDTSSSAASVALLIDDKMTAVHQIAPAQQTQLILPMIDDLLKSKNISLNQLNAIAFGCGPGSFTGVRIAVGVAQGLGFAENLPLISVSSLAALAQAAYNDLGWKNMLAAVDARVQEVYWGAYRVNSAGLVELVGKEMVCAPQNIIPPEPADWHGVGNAWQVYKDHISFMPVAVDIERLPMASAVAQLAKVKYTQKAWVSPENALPVYLRDEVAVKSKK